MFDEVIVGVARNAGKSGLLPYDVRLALVREALDSDPATVAVRAELVDGLLVDFCVSHGAKAIVKGLRGGADFDAETPMALMNRHLADIETVFVMGDPALSHIASSLVKDVARYGGHIEDLVHPSAARAVHHALTP
jgi:pantetheine-phosphate adenylyltransferase